MNSHAIISGAGSGVGQAVAVALVERGWRISIVGRRAEALQQTIAKVGAEHADAYPLDIGDVGAVNAAVAAAIRKHGGVNALVNAAGNNVARRSFEELAYEDWRALLDANLNGVYHLVSATLPSMRAQRAGTIVNIGSEAALRANAKAGPAYVASKFAVSGLTQAINAEEQRHGIRACAIHPGDIDTPLLDKRPLPPSAAARASMLRPEDVAACVLLALELPAHAVIEELVVRPRSVTPPG